MLCSAQLAAAAAQRRYLPVVALACLLLSGCGFTRNPDAAAATAAPDPLKTVVFLGDSLLAGEQNGSLVQTHQANDIASLLSAQAAFAVTQPLIALPGFPNELQLSGTGFPPQVSRVGGAAGGRVDPSATITNFAVPGHTLNDLLSTVPTAQPTTVLQQVTNLVLGVTSTPGTTSPPAQLDQLDQAVALQPTTVFLWIGSNDAQAGLTYADPSSMTPLSSFTTEFTQILSTLDSKTKAHLFVANIPDFTLSAYMTPAVTFSQEVAMVTGRSAAAIEQSLGLVDSDLVNQLGITVVSAELDAIRAGGTPTPLPDTAILSASEQTQFRATLAGYNQVIAQQVTAAGGTLVDMSSYVQSLGAGVAINGQTLTLGYLGGFFSVDSVHPTNTGFALLANQFIASMNTALSLFIPSVDVSAVAAADPLFGLSAGASPQLARGLPPAPHLPSFATSGAHRPGRAASFETILLELSSEVH